MKTIKPLLFLLLLSGRRRVVLRSLRSIADSSASTLSHRRRAAGESATRSAIRRPIPPSAIRWATKYRTDRRSISAAACGSGRTVGLAVSRFGRASRADVDSVDVFARWGTAVNLGHRQYGYHLQTSWIVRATDRLDVAFFAGPSLFNVLQARVTDVQVREFEPLPGSDRIREPMVAGVSTRGVKHRLAGYNYGFDFTFRIAERFGIGLLVRTAMSFRPSVSGHTGVPVAGGSHVGLGARFHF